jgi:hypothetical protein
MNPRKHPDKRLSLFNDPLQRQRYACSLVMILLMIGVAEILQEKEIIFPEMAALTIGMWIVDKRVWRIKTGQMLLLMTLGACTGVLLVLYSPFPLYMVHYPFIYLYYAWVKNESLTFRESLPGALGVVIGSIVLAYGCLKFYDIPVRKFLTNRFLKPKNKISLNELQQIVQNKAGDYKLHDSK